MPLRLGQYSIKPTNLIPFLKSFAIDLWKKYQPELGAICIVLPNRRAALFLKEHLAAEAKQTIFSPEIYSTEDFIYKLSGLQIIDNTELLFELYSVYSETPGEETDTFEAFSKWAPALIADFNEIDRYQADARQLFINLSSIREIENWSLNSKELTGFQQNYIRFWESLGVYYFKLRDKMQKENKAWQGLAYRFVSENILELAEKQDWKKICFAGFNALNASEEKIFTQLLRANKAELYWDSDEYYLNDPGQEAGKFLRRYKSEFSEDENSFRWIGNNLRTGDKNIRIIGASKNITQAKLAGTLLTELRLQNESLRSTALVLADENLLFPILNSIPDEIGEINVTMGYPLRNTPMASLFHLLFQLHVNAEKFSKGRKGEKRFYHTDITGLLRHPYLHQAFRESDLIPALCRYILDNNIIFIGYRQIEKFCLAKFPDEWLKLAPLLISWKSIDDSFKALDQLILQLRSTFITRQQGSTQKLHANVETELLFQFSMFLKRLHSLCQTFGHVSELKTLQTLFAQLANNSTIPFYGEPLSGLQVMGMLETRTLDFENIVLLSANENILPSGKTQNSFIPFDLKKLFGLPQYNDKDAVFAYHFYRLIQRAKNIFLLYNTESDKFGDGEKSRYITQLVNELAKVNPAIRIEESLLELDYQSEESEAVEVVVNKDDAVMDKIRNLAERGFSPTLLNTFRKCPLKFYLHYIVGIRETEEVEEEIGADTMGTVIHEALELFYAPYTGKSVSAGDIKKMQEDLEEKVKIVFARYFPEEVISSGKNLLAFRVSLKFIRTFLNLEEETLRKGGSLFITELEKEMKGYMEVNGIPVNIKGKADRIDRTEKGIRIIDYKTGKAEDRELAVKDWNDLLTDYKLDKSFQLLCYAWLYDAGRMSHEEPLLSGIITFRELSAGLKTVSVPGKKDYLDKPALLGFETILNELIAELFRKESPFTQTREIKNCEFCAFQTFCKR
jgi:CRISPR/Cas system-associated exonuclease Cas4 (RecB family)